MTLLNSMSKPKSCLNTKNMNGKIKIPETGSFVVNNGFDSNCFTFKNQENQLLKIDKEGFHYGGETVKDCGKCYTLLVNFLEKNL